MSRITHWDNHECPYWESWPAIKKYLLAGGYTEAGLKRYFVIVTFGLSRLVEFFKQEWQIEILPSLDTHAIGPAKRGIILPLNDKVVFNTWLEKSQEDFTKVPIPHMKTLCAHGILNSLSILNSRGSYAFIYDDDLISLWEKDVLDVVRSLRVSALTVSNFQSPRARNKRKRPRDALGKLIDEILGKKPDLSWKEVLAEIERYEHQGVILSVKDGKIEWLDKKGKLRSTPYDAIEDRVSRAKKRSTR